MARLDVYRNELREEVVVTKLWIWQVYVNTMHPSACWSE